MSWLLLTMSKFLHSFFHIKETVPCTRVWENTTQRCIAKVEANIAHVLWHENMFLIPFILKMASESKLKTCLGCTWNIVQKSVVEGTASDRRSRYLWTSRQTTRVTLSSVCALITTQRLQWARLACNGICWRGTEAQGESHLVRTSTIVHTCYGRIWNLGTLTM